MSSSDMPALLLALRESVPQAMRERPQWLLWRYRHFEGEPKPRKVPHWASGRKRRGVQGGVDDRRELVGFEPALAQLAQGRYDGLGFAFLPGDGLIGIDIDGAIDAETGEVSARCQAIIDACASYTEYSPSGRGVHIIVEGETKTFKDNSVGVEVFCGSQFFTVTGRRWPGAPEQVVPLADETLRRLQATVRQARQARGGGKGAKPMPAAPVPPEGQDLQRKLEGALDRLSPDMAHDDWVIVGMALKHALGDAGLRLWDYWSSKGTKYPGSDAIARKWASFHGASAHGTVTEATVFKMAVQAGWKPPRKPREARSGSSARAPADDAASTPSPASGGGGGGPEPPPDDEDPPPADDDAPREHWAKRLLGEGGKKDCRENVYTYLVNQPKLKGLVAYDEFAHQVVKTRPPPWDSPPGEWTTNDDYFLALWLAQHERITFRSEATIIAGVAMAAYSGRFHPVRDYLDGLPGWDRTPRLRHWLHECLGAEDSEYTALVGSWFVMGMVQRIREPGCQHDYMIILEGAQGKQKSSALRAMSVHDAWFSDTPVRIGTADALLTLAGKWVYEIAEMDSFNRAETTAVKAYCSSRADRVREPYARRFVDRPRSGVLMGSTNQGEYFKDPTGARRFWPVACDGEILLAKLVEWRDQLFAEAMVRLASADPEERRCWPTRAEEEKYIVPQQERREITDPWFDRLAVWLDSKANYGESGLEVREVERFTVFELLTRCLNVPMDRIDGNRQMSTRVGQIMHKLGWARDRDPKPPRVWFYKRPQRSAAPAAAEPPPAQPEPRAPADWTPEDFNA